MTDTTTKFFLDTIRKRLKRAKDANRVDVKLPASDLALLLELADKPQPVFDLAALAAFAKKPDIELQYVGPSVIVVPQTEAPLPPNTVLCGSTDASGVPPRGCATSP